MDKLESELKKFILKNVEFRLDNKCIKSGKIKVFNTKQFFVKFKLENDQGELEYELPYPYKTVLGDDKITFDYHLSSFCPRTEEVYWKMFAMDKSNASKLHNNYLTIVSLTS